MQRYLQSNAGKLLFRHYFLLNRGLAFYPHLPVRQFRIFLRIKYRFIRLFEQLTGHGAGGHRTADIQRGASHINQGFDGNQQGNQRNR
ncbi:hypothetical protein DES54_11323 [Brenneria salicis ATCC 15712 = DSM 30166]|uniref:Uncharacterized protein n=1 Tax=Brenneria salicis ATCC 15712 = DSM 30166 TaxID=714314 RepID=A0A366I6T1_9GAMM|nr:hypothetical protein DES54_11323 [Brenneria salicis ATCC 15712 = DSM 30166]